MDVISSSVDEKELIDKFRERVADLDVRPEFNNDDSYYRKWLKARNFDLDKAEEMFRKHVKFARANGLDKIGEDFIPKEATKYFYTAKLGYDNEGSVVRILHLGAADLRGLAQSLTKVDAFSFATYLILSDIREQKRDRESKSFCDKQVYVFDLKGLSWSAIIHRAVAQHAYTLLKSYEANHPENLKVVYVMNAPSFFNFIWSWCKTVLPESILSKVEILSPDDVQSVITKTIDPALLPMSVGGTKVDPDGNPDCPSIYSMPLNLSVPDSLMLYQQLGVLENDPTAKRTVVECGCACRVRLAVKEPNALIQWDFQTVGYDIRFGLCFRENESADSMEIITPHRVECHMYPESGTFSCINAGLYELVFDNTYSWMTKKEVIYKVKVVAPNEISYN